MSAVGTLNQRIDSENPELEQLARRARWLVVSTVANSGGGHIGGPLSAMEALIALYFRVMNVKAHDPYWRERDRFILSKGHCTIGLYTVLALRGYFPIDELKTFDKERSRLQGHPDVTKLPGLETSSGSLGQGLSVGLGMALGARMRGEKFHTFVMIGDGELQEGMIWEALHIAPRYTVGNLTVIVDCNGLQQFGWSVEPESRHRCDRQDPWAEIDLRGIFERLGWRVLETDGHDYSQLIPMLDGVKACGYSRQPTAILARTTKGKGTQLTEGKFAWHAKIPNREELQSMAADLGIVEVA